MTLLVVRSNIAKLRWLVSVNLALILATLAAVLAKVFQP